MPRPSLKTEYRVNRMLEMHRDGRSNREIAAEIGVTHTVIGTWLKQAGVAREAPASPPGEPQDAPATAGALDVIAQRLAAVRGTLARLTPMFERGEYDATPYEKLVRLETWLASQLAQLTPPEPPDPEKDPTNLAEADRVRQRFERLVAEARKHVRCAHCGENPYGRP
jgi:hypothetical protein